MVKESKKCRLVDLIVEKTDEIVSDLKDWDIIYLSNVSIGYVNGQPIFVNYGTEAKFFMYLNFV